MIIDMDRPSPFMQQYIWESSDSVITVTAADGICNRCGGRGNWGWCPNCHPLHYRELP